VAEEPRAWWDTKEQTHLGGLALGQDSDGMQDDSYVGLKERGLHEEADWWKRVKSWQASATATAIISVL
jgi:hypothetical protein